MFYISLENTDCIYLIIDSQAVLIWVMSSPEWLGTALIVFGYEYPWIWFGFFFS